MLQPCHHRHLLPLHFPRTLRCSPCQQLLAVNNSTRSASFDFRLIASVVYLFLGPPDSIGHNPSPLVVDLHPIAVLIAGSVWRVSCFVFDILLCLLPASVLPVA